MYTKDKLFRITLRLNEKQFAFVKKHADSLKISPSEFLRMTLTASMASQNNEKEGYGRENDEANFNDFI